MTGTAGPADGSSHGRAVQPQGGAPTHSRGRPQIGRVIGGRYRLLERLAVGGMGTVWRARDEVVERDVAVKEPRVPPGLEDRDRETAYLRIQREARAAARVDHPSVVTIHDVVLEGEEPWIVMELVRGRSLAHVLEKDGPMTAPEAARTILPVVGALGAAHGAGVLHRDVRPANVLLGPYGRVVLTDFGIAKVQGEAPLTETGSFVGSPESIAPERVLGQRPGPESDLFSLGVLLYALVEGRSPFRRPTKPATLQAVINDTPPELLRAEGLAPVIHRLLDKDPAGRPSAEEVERVLKGVAEGGDGGMAGAAASGAGTRSPNRPKVARRATGRPRAWLALAATCATAVVAVLVLVLLVLDPFRGDGSPDGWRTYDETARLKASVAAPVGYVRSVDEESVTFSDPGGVYSISLGRFIGAAGTSVVEAGEWLRFYREDPGSGMFGAVGTVKKTELHGARAAELMVTYRRSEGQAAARLRLRELVYVDGDRGAWKLSVSAPAASGNRAEADELFDQAVASLRIDGLG